MSRWATRHPAFLAELNRRKTDRALAAARRIDELTLRAIEAVEKAVEGGDPGVALQWLRLRGLTDVTTRPEGPTSAAGAIEARRRSLPAHGGLQAQDRSVDELFHGRPATTEEASEVILGELGG